MAGWLDGLFGRLRSVGVDIPLGYGINYGAGLSAQLNPSTKFVDVDVADAVISPANLAPETHSAAPVFVLRIPLVAGTPGTADDVTGPVAPFDLRILDRWVDVTTAISATSVRVRSAPGGAGNSLSGTLSTATDTDGVRATASTHAAQVTLTEGAEVYVRRTDRGVAGTVYLLCERV